MKRLLNCLLILLLPLVEGSSLLQYQSGSAYCTGNLTDLEFVSATCDDENGCTWGSDVSLFVQVNATTDLPSEVKVSASPSIPHFPDSGVFETYHYQNYTSYSCDTLLKAPAGDDAGYSCPDAGVYNYRFTFGMFGDPDAWYGSYHGFNVGMSVKIFDVGNNADYGFCYLEMKVKKGADSSYSDLAFFGTGLASLTGVAAVGYMYRRRKLATLAPHSHAEAEETITNFELISDQFVNV